MGQQNLLTQYREQINLCARCGSCQAHCPVYDQHHSEGSVARGKLSLAKALLDKTIPVEKRLEQDVSLCLLCGSCVTQCPNNIPTDKIVAAMRRYITADKGLSLTAKAISAATRSPSRMKKLVKSAGRLTPLFKSLPRQSGLRLRYPFPGMKDRTFPSIPKKPLLERYPGVIKGEKDKPVVGFFTGCSINYLYPRIGSTIIRLLNRFGYSIVLPENQGCCGFPARSSGDGKQVDTLSAANREAFQSAGVDYIITACATCLSGLQQSTGFTDNHFTDTITDIHVFLKSQGCMDSIAELEYNGDIVTVTYHDPCHLRTKGITREPRQLLEALPSVDFVEMKHADWCCGLGGTFSLYHYQTSKAIGHKKMTSLADTPAQYLATGCPGCIMQLQDAANHYGSTLKVVHTLELTEHIMALIPSFSTATR